MDLLLKHKLAAIVVVVAIAAIAWYFLGSPGADDGTVLSSQTAVPMSPEAQHIITDLQSLRTISLSSTVFSDASFQALQDFSTPIQTEPVGRDDPFAPLSAFEIQSGSTQMQTAATATPAIIKKLPVKKR